MPKFHEKETRPKVPPWVRTAVLHRLRDHQSPEQIAGAMRGKLTPFIVQEIIGDLAHRELCPDDYRTEDL